MTSVSVDGSTRWSAVRGSWRRGRGALLPLGLAWSLGCGSRAVVPVRQEALVIPFEVDNGFIVVQATVDGHRGAFVWDTGSPQIYLSQNYIKPARGGGIDTVRSADSTSSPQARIGFVTLHTLQLGAMVYRLDSIGHGPPIPMHTNAAITIGDKLASVFTRPMLGTIGLTAMEPFETIVDYPHRQILLIPLDRAGHRLAQLPGLIPTATVPLLPILSSEDTAFSFWGIQAQLGGQDKVLLVDTGNPNNSLDRPLSAQMRAHFVSADTPNSHPENGPLVTLDRLTVDGRAFDSLSVNLSDDNDGSALGYGFLSRLQIVGFNLRTQQLTVYVRS